MTPSKRLRKLHELYDQIPAVECKGLCHLSCSTIPVYPVELDQLERLGGKRLPILFEVDDTHGNARVIGDRIGGACPFLVLKRCSVYQNRPMICRLYGTVPEMTCPHGCQPTRMLNEQEVRKIQVQIEKL